MTSRKLYMWDYTRSAPVEGALMEQQLAFAQEFLKTGVVNGLIFHPSYAAKLDVPAVRLSKEWIARHGEDVCPRG